jgi:hypothetical protein
VIIQAVDTEAAREAVERAGGTISHELGVIDAVAAELTATQIETVSRAFGVTRVQANVSVKTASAECRMFENKFKMDGKKIEWELVNEENQTLTLDRLTVMWPPMAGALKKLDVGAKFLDVEAYGPPFHSM